MEKEEVKQLVNKYYEGKTTLQEEARLRKYFESADVPEELQADAAAFEFYGNIFSQDASLGYNPFDKIGKENSINNNQPVSKQEKDSFLLWAARIAAGIALLLAGFAASQFLNSQQNVTNQQVAELQKEVQQMKSALMNTGNYENVSAGERLSAVNISSRMQAGEEKLDGQVTDILIYTMNNDHSINVRMAAAEALFRFRDDLKIKRALVNALGQQDEPMMQITLINMLVDIKAKNAINEMEKMLVNTNTQEIVRDRLKTGIAQLKA